MSMRFAAPSVVALCLAAGCLPPLPSVIGEDTGDDTDDDATTLDPSEGGTTGGSTDDDDTDDDDATDDDTDSSDDGTDGGACGPIQALSYDDDDDFSVGNCHIYAEFDDEAVGLTKLRPSIDSDVELLYDGPADMTAERLSGVLLYEPDSPTASWAGMTPSGMPTKGTWVLQAGDAVHRIEVWSTTTVGDNTLETRQIYTTIADGRMFFDTYAHVLAAAAASDGIGSYVAIRSEAFTDAHWDGGQGVQTTSLLMPPAGEPQELYSGEGDAAILCAADYLSGLELGFSRFADPNPPSGPPYLGTRLTRSRPAGNRQDDSLRLQADWIRSTAPVPTPADFHGETMLSLAVGDPRDPCAVISDNNQAYQGHGTLEWLEGFVTVGEFVGSEGHGGEHFSPGGGFYYVAVDSDPMTETIEVRLSTDAATQPTMLLYIADLSEAQLAGITLDGTALSPGSEFLVQDAMLEGGGGSGGGLDPGLFVLIGVPVSPGAQISIGL